MLNESWRPSNLTEKQRREALRALYGLPAEKETMSPDPLANLNYEQRVELRRMLDEQDRRSSTLREFDLNKPPVPAYEYKEFPFLMYKREIRLDGEGKQIIVRLTEPARTHEERERMLAEGWSTQPFTSEGAEIPLTAAEQAEVEATDKLLTKKPRKL